MRLSSQESFNIHAASRKKRYLDCPQKKKNAWSLFLHFAAATSYGITIIFDSEFKNLSSESDPVISEGVLYFLPEKMTIRWFGSYAEKYWINVSRVSLVESAERKTFFLWFPAAYNFSCYSIFKTLIYGRIIDWKGKNISFLIWMYQ